MSHFNKRPLAARCDKCWWLFLCTYVVDGATIGARCRPKSIPYPACAAQCIFLQCFKKHYPSCPFRFVCTRYCALCATNLETHGFIPNSVSISLFFLLQKVFTVIFLSKKNESSFMTRENKRLTVKNRKIKGCNTG